MNALCEHILKNISKNTNKQKKKKLRINNKQAVELRSDNLVKFSCYAYSHFHDKLVYMLLLIFFMLKVQ